MVSYFYVKDTQARLLIVRAMCTSLVQSAQALRPQFWPKFLSRVIKPTGRTNEYCRMSVVSLLTLITLTRLSCESLTPRDQTTTRGPTMTKQQCLPGISFQIEECTQCGASSWLIWDSWREYGHETGSRSPHGCFCSRFPFRFRFRSRISVFSSCPNKLTVAT